MGVPTTTTAPQNVYYCIDDFAAGTNPATPFTPGSGGSGLPVTPEFVALTAANALTMAYLFATLLQRPLRLVPKYSGQPPYTLVLAGLPGIGLTLVPSGISY
jgi:hypothetical protein